MPAAAQSTNRTKWIIIISVTVFISVALTIGLVNYFILSSAEDRDPALDFFPKKEAKESLIWVNRNNDQYESIDWANKIQEFIKPYKNTSISSASAERCSYKNDKTATEETFCFVDIDKMRGCVEDSYGYTSGKPCVLLKLSKVPGWTPIPYISADFENGTTNANANAMPKDLIDRIKRLTTTPNELDRGMLNTIWISCDGANPADRENIGNLTFYAPGIEALDNFPGIPGYYFPFKNQQGYQEPFVFVKFENPQAHVKIGVECKAWAKNINTEGELGVGHQSVQFELLID